MNWEFSHFYLLIQLIKSLVFLKSLLQPPFWALVFWEWVEFWLFQIISWYLVYSCSSFLLLPILVCYIFLGIYPLHLDFQLCYVTWKETNIGYSPFSFCILFLCSVSQPHTCLWWKDCQYLLIFLVLEKQSLLYWFFDRYFVDFYSLLVPSFFFLLMWYFASCFCLEFWFSVVSILCFSLFFVFSL